MDTVRDPSQERLDRLHADTVADLAKWYLKSYVHGLSGFQKKRKAKKPPGIQADTQRIKGYILPAIGSRKVAAVERQDIERIHASLSDRTHLANRVLSLLNCLFSLAEKKKLRQPYTNPCRGIGRYEEVARKRYLGPEELARLGETLAKDEKSGTKTVWVVAAIRPLLLTGCRRNEILELRWANVDLMQGLLALPDSKTGEKTILLGAPAKEILSRLERLSGNPYVTVGRITGKHLATLRRPWKRISKRAKIEGVRIHDLRHSFATIRVGSGLSLPLIGALLGHSRPSTTARYAHTDQDPLRQAADRIAGEIDAAIRGGTGEVVEFPSG